VEVKWLVADERAMAAAHWERHSGLSSSTVLYLHAAPSVVSSVLRIGRVCSAKAV